VITVDRDIEGLQAKGKICVDNFKGAYGGVAYMIERGYRRILHLGGPSSSKPSLDRWEGYKKALEDAGYAYDETLYVEGSYTLDWGYDGVLRALSEQLEFDGIFCGNDMIAIGAIKALHERHVRIPEDIGVMGFDDIYMATVVSPPLTTVSQPNYAMGFKAAQMLIQMINYPTTPSEIVELKTELIIRESIK
jgi:LacI family transcriptional regulator